MSNEEIFILVGCEESQVVTIAFRELGFSAFSCDLIECSGGHPEWHLQMSVFDAIKLRHWDLGIFFPPCTDLAVSGAAHFEVKRQDGRQQASIQFFLDLANCGIERIAIENPIGIMSRLYKKPSQIIHPYYFGDPEPKSTCLWLKNLPKLIHNESVTLFDEVVTHVEPNYIYSKKTGKKFSKIHWGWGKDRAKQRSKTFPGIASAMANQWGEYLINKTI